VGLHTWSFDRFNQVKALGEQAEKYGFNLLLPEFRGPNLTTNPHCTEACASVYARQDIVDAVEYICKTENVDCGNIFLMGSSGGGHMALMMAAYRPKLFRAVTSFVPITDLSKWVTENKNYSEHIIACCSGSEEEMRKRSPISYLDEIAQANVKVFHGKYDDSVPVTQSICFFNEMMKRHPDASVYLDIFDGGHETDMATAFHWIMTQYKKTGRTKVTG